MITFWLFFLAIILLLVLSGFFSGSETALTAASKARMLQLERNGNKNAGLVRQLINSRERLIGALLLGNNLVNILASALATSVFISFFGDTGVVFATLAMTVLVVIFAEVLPKTYAIGNADAVSVRVAPLISALVRLFGPLASVVERIVNGILRLVVREGSGENDLSGHEELRGAVDLLHQEGAVIKKDRDMLGGLLDLTEMDVEDVMIHRTKMDALDVSQAPEETFAAALASPHSRLPIWEGKPDNIIGVLHVRDLWRALHNAGGDRAKVNVRTIAAQPWFVPDTTPLRAQLNAFLKHKTHFALVVDEYGEVQGLVTLEDILEEIVGDITDEHDIDMVGVEKQSDGSVVVDGTVPVRDLNRGLDWALPEEQATTIAGLVIHEARTIPVVGQGFTFYGYRFRILRKHRNQVTSIRVTPVLV